MARSRGSRARCHVFDRTDEHGQKIQRVAAENGMTPKQYVDRIVSGIKDLWQMMKISYDKFIRTTDEEHAACVQKVFKALYDKGDIYISEYEGWYCTPCESFWTETQLVDGMCPDCGRGVEKTRKKAISSGCPSTRTGLSNI